MTEFRPGSFQILPTIIKNLIIINVLVFIAQQVLPSSGFSLVDTFALHTWQSSLFKPWQLVTHLFMHASFGHIFMNMFALWMFGSVLENVWGPKRFLIFYIICGLGAAFCHLMVLYFENQQMIHDYLSLQSYPGDVTEKLQLFITKYNNTGQSLSVDYAQALIYSRINEATLGASGAVFGCLAAFGYLFAETYIYIYFFFPLKAKWFVLLYAGFELYASIQSSAGDNIAHVAHLGGALAGFLMAYSWNKKNKKTFY